MSVADEVSGERRIHSLCYDYIPSIVRLATEDEIIRGRHAAGRMLPDGE